MYSQGSKLCRLLPTCRLVKGKYCCRVKISSFPKEADEERLSGELGVTIFMRGACGIDRKCPEEGKKMKLLVLLVWSLYAGILNENLMI